jgi:hypothetical protein
MPRADKQRNDASQALHNERKQMEIITPTPNGLHAYAHLSSEQQLLDCRGYIVSRIITKDHVSLFDRVTPDADPVVALDHDALPIASPYMDAGSFPLSGTEGLTFVSVRGDYGVDVTLVLVPDWNCISSTRISQEAGSGRM